MERSLLKRSELITSLPENYNCSIPKIIQSSLAFEFSKYNSKIDQCEENSIKASHPGKNLTNNLFYQTIIKLFNISNMLGFKFERKTAICIS